MTYAVMTECVPMLADASVSTRVMGLLPSLTPAAAACFREAARQYGSSTLWVSYDICASYLPTRLSIVSGSWYVLD